MYTPRSDKGGRFLNALLEKKKELRQNETGMEKLLWSHIRDSKLGYRFRRQHVVYNFIPDFYCVEKSLAIEVDGEVHNNNLIRDRERDNLLSVKGVTVIRFTNQEIELNIDNCVEILKTNLAKL